MIGKYFGVGEFACHDGTPYPVIWVPTRLVKVVSVLDPVREEWGSAVHVRSGYRTPEWNHKIGGALHSQHMEGTAADVYPNDPADSDRLWSVVLGMYQAGKLPGLGGLGRYPGMWVHIDVRDRNPPDHLAQWTGSGLGSER